VLAGPGAESFSRAILNSLPAHLVVIESDGRVAAVNKAWEKFAHEVSDFLPDAPGLGENYLDALTEGRVFERSQVEAASRGIQDVLDRRRVRFETEYAIELGSNVRWFMLTVTPLLGADGGAVLAHIEITARKAAEVEAQENHEMLRAVLDSSADGIVVADPTGRFTLFNKAARELAGVGMFDTQPSQWGQDFGLFHPGTDRMFTTEELPLYRAMMGESTDRVMMHVRNPNVPPEGRTLSVSGRPWLTPDGGISGGVVVFRDVSHDLRGESRARFQIGVLDAVPNAVLALDPEGRVVYWNRAAEALVGWTAGDLVGRRGRDMLLSEDERAQVDGIRAYVEGGGIYRGEFPARRPDGSEVPILALATALRDVHGTLTGFVVVGVDLSDLRTTQDALRARDAELRQFQKMEAIGRLAGGVAHDFNNLLTVIRGYMDLMLARLPENEPAREDALQVAKAADRAAELTGQLLAFSRSKPIAGVLVDLNKVVTEFLPMLRRTLGENIEIKSELSDGLGAVRADAGQIGQVLLNLALNARDAMPEGGTLTVSTENADLDATYPGTHVPLPPGPYVRLSVADTGIGMDEETARACSSLLLDQGPGQRHGSGAVDRVRHHPPARRRDLALLRARPRHDRAALPAAHPRHVLRAGGAARARGEIEGWRDDPPGRGRVRGAPGRAAPARVARLPRARGRRRRGRARGAAHALRTHRPPAHRRDHAGHERPRGRRCGARAAPGPARLVRLRTFR
jgi:PAS domain S-box-containing protein